MIATSPLGVRVIKLGGSLLEFDGLVSAWTLWLSEQPPAANVVIVGGGKLVDALRDLDQANSLGDEAAHWLSVRAMGYTAANVASILPNVELVSRMDELDLTSACTTILDVWQFLFEDDRFTASPLPCSWQVTSDSIAARVAERLGARELVLLKSTSPPEFASMSGLAEQKFVDAYFPQAVPEGLSIRSVNLRDEKQAETRIA
jgi:5-(aminomethyl)-3-furanmethanol phosphate kinase